MQIDPRHLVHFATIVETGSFTAAAQALGTTQPALSRLVADLEKRLDVLLLESRRKPVSPTRTGRELADQGFAIRAAMADASLIADEARKGARGLIRIGAPPFICDFALPVCIPAFHARYNNVAFEITAAYSRELRGMIARNELDIALALTGPASRPRLQARHLIDIEHAIVCRNGHPLLRKRRASGAGSSVQGVLAQAGWIGHAANSVLRDVMRGALAAAGLESVNEVAVSGSAGVIATLLSNSDYLAVLPVFSVLDALERRELALVPFALDYPALPLYAVTREVAAKDVARDAFVSALAKQFSTMQANAATALKKRRDGQV